LQIAFSGLHFMVRVVQGNALQFFTLMTKGNNEHQQLSPVIIQMYALRETQFLGHQPEAEEYSRSWLNINNKLNCTEKNPSHFLGELFRREAGEDDPNWFNHDFAFINNHGELCRFMVVYNPEDLSQWALGLMKNTYLAAPQQNLMILTSLDYSPLLHPDINESPLDLANHSLAEDADNPFITELIYKILDLNSGLINPHYQRILPLLSTLSLRKKTELKNLLIDAISQDKLWAENEILDRIIKYGINISSGLFAECLNGSAGLKEAMGIIPFGADEQVNKNSLEVIISCYENGRLIPFPKHYLMNKILPQIKGHANRHPFLWNETQIKLIPYLIESRWFDLATKVLGKKYYQVVYHLFQMGLSEKLPQFFKLKEKRTRLDSIAELNRDDIQKASLIFWIESDLSEEEFTHLVHEMKRYPLLASTLCSLFKTNEYTIPALMQIAKDPQLHLAKSVAVHCRKLENVASLVKKLNLEELHLLIESLQVINQLDISESIYQLIGRKDSNGRIARLILPSLSNIENLQHQETLVNILYTELTPGISKLNQEIEVLTDEWLRNQAKELKNRIICAQQVQNLKCEPALVSLAAADTLKARRFREVMFGVGEKTKAIQAKLSQKDRIAYGRWQEKEQGYLKKLYEIAWEAITTNNFNPRLHNDLENAKKDILAIVDPQENTSLKLALLIISNLVISLCTLFIANAVNKKCTGSYTFFTQSRYERLVISSHKNMEDQLKKPLA